jgi:hypothetical protein
MRAYPRERRLRDGAALRDLAAELGERHGSRREAIGLLRGGLAARAEGMASAARAPWGEALRRLALPLAAVNAAIWVAGAARLETLDLGVFWTLLLAGSLVALGGAVARARAPMLIGTLVVLATLLADGVRTGLGHGSRPAVLDASLGNLAVDVYAAWLPAAALLVAAALALPARGDWRPRALAARGGLASLPAVVLVLLMPGVPLYASEEVGLVVAVLGAVPPLAAVAGALLAGRDPALPLVGALLLVAWTPEAVWLATGLLPVDNATLALALGLWTVGGAVAAAAVAGLVVLARRPAHV